MNKVKILILLSFGHLIGHWYIGVLMLVLPLIKQDFALSFTEVGLIISLRSLAGAAGNTTSGIIADILGRPRFILILGATGLALCWFFIGFAHLYLLLLLLFPLATMFSNLWHAPSMSALSEAYPERKGFALGVHGAAANLGQAISPPVVGLLITYIGWRTVLKAHLIPGVLLSVLLILFLPRFRAIDDRQKTVGDFWELVNNRLIKNKALLLISMISALRTMGQRCIETYLALFLAHKLGLNPVLVGSYLFVLTFSGTFPEPIIGWLSDHIGRTTILWLGLTISGLSAIAMTLVPPGIPLIVCVAFLGFFYYSLRPLIFAFALDVTPPEIGATTVSYVFTWNQAISSISPLVGGFLADAFGIQFALYFVALLSLASAFFCYMKGLLNH